MCGLVLKRLGLYYTRDELVVRVDPGTRIGLSISYCGEEIEASLHCSVEGGGLVSHVLRILDGLHPEHRMVKVGDGDLEQAHQISKTFCMMSKMSLKIELVDEYKTSPKTKCLNQGGRRDMISARPISRRDGVRIPSL